MPVTHKGSFWPALLALWAIPSLASANPSPAAGPLALPLAFGFEAIAVAIVAAVAGYNWGRMGYCWFATTAITFFGILWPLLALITAVNGDGWALLGGLAIGEAAVVAIEACLLRFFSHQRFFNPNHRNPLPWSAAISVSLVINFLSFLIGAL